MLAKDASKCVLTMISIILHDNVMQFRSFTACAQLKDKCLNYETVVSTTRRKSEYEQEVMQLRQQLEAAQSPLPTCSRTRGSITITSCSSAGKSSASAFSSPGYQSEADLHQSPSKTVQCSSKRLAVESVLTEDDGETPTNGTKAAIAAFAALDRTTVEERPKGDDVTGNKLQDQPLMLCELNVKRVKLLGQQK